MLIFGVLFMRRAVYPLCSLLYMSAKLRYTCTIKEGPLGRFERFCGLFLFVNIVCRLQCRPRSTALCVALVII